MPQRVATHIATPDAIRSNPTATISVVTAAADTRTKPVKKVPNSAPAVLHAGQTPDGGPGRGQVEQLQLDHGRRHRAQHGGRREEAERGQHEDPDPPPVPDPSPSTRTIGIVAIASAPPSTSSTGQQSSRIDVVGGNTSDPGADRDPGEDRADDPREGLEADADVGREETPGEDLEHEHGRRGSGDQRDRQPAAGRSAGTGSPSTDLRDSGAGGRALGGGHAGKATTTRAT